MQDIQPLVEGFYQHEGRRPRILVANLGQDGHDRRQKVIAVGFAQLGFDVDVGPPFRTQEEITRQAIENDVHIVAVSSLKTELPTLVPQLRDQLDRHGRSDSVIAVDGVTSAQDHNALCEAGATAVFGPGKDLSKAAGKLIRELASRLAISLDNETPANQNPVGGSSHG